MLSCQQQKKKNPKIPFCLLMRRPDVLENKITLTTNIYKKNYTVQYSHTFRNFT